MDLIIQTLNHHWENLVARVSGPLNFRLIIMPLTVTMLAIRAHLRDVREGRPTVLGVFFLDRSKRRRLLRTGLADFGKVFVVACVLDTVYQIYVTRSFSPGEMLVVAVVCAIVPYYLVRGVVLRGARWLYHKCARPAAPSALAPPEDSNARSDHELHDRHSTP